MKECAQPYYILDGNVREYPSFDEKLIHEGTSLYEVVRLMEGKFLFLQDHLLRLINSLEMAGIQSWVTQAGIKEALAVLQEKNKVTNGNIKIVINVQEDGSRHFLVYFVYHRYPSPQDYAKGVNVITYSFERLDPNKKIWRPEFRRHVAKTLYQASAFEALLMDSNKCITEASKANIFAIREGKVITAPEAVVLPGITRHYVLEICRDLSLEMVSKKISMDEIPSLEGLFLTGTSLHVLPIHLVNDHPIPLHDPILKDVIKSFQKVIENHLN